MTAKPAERIPASGLDTGSYEVIHLPRSVRPLTGWPSEVPCWHAQNWPMRTRPWPTEFLHGR